MSKQDLIEAVAAKTKLAKSDVSEVINATLDTITSEMKKDAVVLTGFGTFAVSKRAARDGRNPKTGEAIKIPAMTVPKFKAGKALKDAIR